VAKSLQAIIEIAGSLSPTLEKAATQAKKSLEGINIKAIALGAGVATAGVAIGKATIEAGKYLVDLGSQFDGAVDAIRIGTGATGEALNSLMSDFDEVYKSVPTNMEDAGKVIADYNTRLGLTGPVLQDISKQALQVSDMFEDDLNSVIEESSQAFQAWNIDTEDMSKAMDYVFKASQSTGAGFTDLMGKVQQFAPQLQEMGYSFEESTALIGQLDKAGVNTSEVLSAMKKGVGSLAKEGISASAGMELYAEKIKNAKDMTEATTIASEIFGSKAGSTMAAAIREGTLSVADLAKELGSSSETIGGAAEDTYDFAERLQLFKQQAEVALEPLAGTMFDTLNEIMPVAAEAMEGIIPIIQEMAETIIPVIQDIMPQLIPLFQEFVPILLEMASSLAGQLLPPLLDMIQEILPVLLPLISQIMPLLAKIITAIMPTFIKLITTLLPPIMKIVTAILPVIINLINTLLPIFMSVIDLLMPILDIIMELIDPIVNLINSGVTPLIAVLGTLISQVLSALGPALEFIAGLFSGAIKGAIEGIKPIIESLMQVFTGIVDFVNNVFSGNWSAAWENIVQVFDGIISGISGIFKVPINFVIGGINEFLGGINGIAIPDWVPLVGGLSFNIPLIPMLAKGGFTEGISIAGEAGTEAVISFDPSARGANIGYWEQAGEMLGVYDSNSQTATAGSLLNMNDFSLSELSQPNTSIIYDFSGLTWSPVVEGGTAEENDDMLRKLKSHEAEFFDWLERWLQQREVTAYA
jgi:TP901 family phage tail tape measure protein